jgi:hypothetical protein
VGYAEDGRGNELWIPETDSLVTTVHVIINEVIPQYTQEYVAELEAHLKAVAVKTGPTATLHDYEFLKSTCHLDDEDGLVYRVTRVAVIQGDIAIHRLDSRRKSPNPCGRHMSHDRRSGQWPFLNFDTT